MLYYQDPKLILNFIPRKLGPESVVTLTLIGRKKKEVFLESSELNLTTSILGSDLLHFLENRFWIYEKNPYLEKQSYAFSFQTIDKANQSFLFSRKRKQLSLNLYNQQIFNCSRFLIQQRHKQNLLKSRILFLTKGGYILLCLGMRVYLSSINPRQQKKIMSSYKIWFLKNLSHYGFLKYFFFNSCELKKKEFLNSKENLFYYKKNQNCSFSLTLRSYSQQFFGQLIKK